ncbi:MAG: butyrate kinase [Acidobacteriota bacterium]
MKNLILVINTGNTSTKIGIFDLDKEIFTETIKHSDKELSRFSDINEQLEFREHLVLEFLKDKNIDINTLKAVAARGGLLKPLASGTYFVNEEMIKDLKAGKNGMHASHLSAQIGNSIAEKSSIHCYIVDPISVDEFTPVARLSGHKLFNRIMLSHALNMKAVSKRYAKENNLNYNDLNLIIIHLGTGISVSAHQNGKMVDSINSSEEGTFSPDRAGGIPVLQAAKYIIENKIDFKTFSNLIFGNGGLQSYLNTKDFMKIENMYKSGDKKVIEVVDAMAYQVAKDAGSMATVLTGKIDKIIITGGMANSELLVNLISVRINFLATLLLYPGEDEMTALAEGVSRILTGEEEEMSY